MRGLTSLGAPASGHSLLANIRRNTQFTGVSPLPDMITRVYAIHFLTHGGDVFAVEWVQAADDEAAQQHAKRLRTPFGKGHEIWEGDRLVAKMDY